MVLRNLYKRTQGLVKEIKVNFQGLTLDSFDDVKVQIVHKLKQNKLLPDSEKKFTKTLFTEKYFNGNS